MSCQTFRIITTAGTLPIVLLSTSEIGSKYTIRLGKRSWDARARTAASGNPVLANASFIMNNAANKMSKGRSISSNNCRVGSVRLTIRQAATSSADISRGSEVANRAKRMTRPTPQTPTWRRSKVNLLSGAGAAGAARLDRHTIAIHPKLTASPTRAGMTASAK